MSTSEFLCLSTREDVIRTDLGESGWGEGWSGFNWLRIGTE
jgi:hypothetical protein